MDYFQSPDDRLLRGLLERDAGALEALYDRYSRAVYSLALRMLGDPELAADVTQDVFLRVWRQPDRYDPRRGEFATWLLGVSHHRAVDTLQTMRSRNSMHERLRVYAVVESSSAPEPEELAILEQQRSAVQSVLMQLPDVQRQALDMAFYQGLTHVEIAERTQTPLGTVKTRIRAAMQRVKIALDAVGVGID